jgi:hypothetical protein
MLKSICICIFIFISVPTFAKEEVKQQITSTLQFNYKMTLKVDLKKRQQILKANGEEPTIYDKAITYVSGDIHVANVVDTVDKKQGNLKITSVMTPTAVLSYAIGDKSYRRESLCELSKNGYRTYSYFEKRGDAIRTTTLIDYKKMNADFFTGKKIERTEKINGDINDVLSVVYENLASIKKSKTIFINNSKSNKPIRFDEAESLNFTVNGKKYRARRYSKLINKSDGATFDIWLDEESKIPLRYLIGLNENYGATMLFELESFKKLP